MQSTKKFYFCQGQLIVLLLFNWKTLGDFNVFRNKPITRKANQSHFLGRLFKVTLAVPEPGDPLIKLIVLWKHCYISNRQNGGRSAEIGITGKEDTTGPYLY